MQDSTVAGLWLNHSWLLVHIIFLNITSFGKTTNKHNCCQLKFNQSIAFIALHLLFCSHPQIISTQGHDRPAYLLCGRLWVGRNETLEWAKHDLPQLFTVISIYPFEEKRMFFWLAKVWVLTSKRVILSKILHNRMKIKVNANRA